MTHLMTIKFRGQEAEVEYSERSGWAFLDPALRGTEVTTAEEIEICDQIAEKAAKSEWPHGS